MTFFDTLSEKTHQNFEARHQVRENALNQTRALTRCSANAIRAIHRGEKDIAEEAMRSGRTIVEDLKQSVKPYPEIYFSGYTQDALKEYVEARLTIDVISNQPLPMPEELGVEYATYIRGLAEIIGELRPKASYYDLILQNKSLVPISKIAKDYGMSGKAFNKLLHELGVQYKMGDTWLLYQQYADQGYTQSRTHAIDAEKSRMHTYWTQKGRLFLYDLLKNRRGLLPMIERNSKTA
jgi:phage antirepressor YoqD-like protein